MTRQMVDAPPNQRRLTMSYEDWLAWAGESSQSEWVDGEVIAFMPPKTVHMLVSGFLYALLSQYAHLLSLGRVIYAPFEMRLSRSAREPDLLFVAREHLERLTPERLVGPADLAVELISDDSVARDRADKFYEYQEAGVREYWIFDPRPGKQRSDFYRLNDAGSYEPGVLDADGRYHSLVLPGFWLRPDWLWQDPLPDPFSLIRSIAPETPPNTMEATPGGTKDATGAA